MNVVEMSSLSFVSSLIKIGSAVQKLNGERDNFISLLAAP
jgi:hypothetical protein